jgi:Holliday junction resolvase RusA-like endonuclease
VVARKASRPAADITANRPRAIDPADGLERREAITKINCVQVAFVVDASPIGKGRPRFGRGHVYTPQKTRDYETQVAWKAKFAMAGRRPISGPLRIALLFELAAPASWSKARSKSALDGEILPVGRPDLDNLIKCVLDAINCIVFADDSQIAEIFASKTYGAAPKVSASVTQILPPPWVDWPPSNEATP